MTDDTNAPLRVLLADDHHLVRSALRLLLDASLMGNPEVDIVGEAADGDEAVQLARELRPDVVLMDVAMPGAGGLEATRRIREERPEAHVLMLSMHAEAEYVGRALSSGASGYLLKDSSADELAIAVRAVARGDTYLSPRVSSDVVHRFLAGEGPAENELDRLTPRQRQVLTFVANGHTSREIAETLGVSVKTVEAHRSEIMDRLAIRDVPGLVRFAVRTGLVGLE
ncbi:MAG: response regulator transcription factor [Gemmatimonadota bacterium]|nr:response regulator transcription factor [Gemmatimonadota bacterium]